MVARTLFLCGLALLATLFAGATPATARGLSLAGAHALASLRIGCSPETAAQQVVDARCDDRRSQQDYHRKERTKPWKRTLSINRASG